MKRLAVGILLFDEVEVLDFAGPFEVFATARDENGEPLCDVMTISGKAGTVSARNGLMVTPSATTDVAGPLDILIVPGGYGAEQVEIRNASLLSWIAAQEKEVLILASVCTGAFLLAEAGLLAGLPATTHWMDIPRLRSEYPEVHVRENIRFVDTGHIITSAGISAGIDMSLHILGRLFGTETAERTARRMEYRLADITPEK